MIGFWPYPQTLDYARKACQGQTFSTLQKFVNCRLKKFYNIGPWAQGLLERQHDCSLDAESSQLHGCDRIKQYHWAYLFTSLLFFQMEKKIYFLHTLSLLNCQIYMYSRSSTVKHSIRAVAVSTWLHPALMAVLILDVYWINNPFGRALKGAPVRHCLYGCTLHWWQCL
jgi:hypothetical protein